mmetsp:Transcript_161184/g.517445  ORF Transcript_161184/g.517445 Transcript_161184/m.517445 type:complete len:422 (-) Transcript_161184:958-2223(-)
MRLRHGVGEVARLAGRKQRPGEDILLVALGGLGTRFRGELPRGGARERGEGRRPEGRRADDGPPAGRLLDRALARQPRALQVAGDLPDAAEWQRRRRGCEVALGSALLLRLGRAQRPRREPGDLPANGPGADGAHGELWHSRRRGRLRGARRHGARCDPRRAGGAAAVGGGWGGRGRGAEDGGAGPQPPAHRGGWFVARGVQAGGAGRGPGDAQGRSRRFLRPRRHSLRLAALGSRLCRRGRPRGPDARPGGRAVAAAGLEGQDRRGLGTYRSQVFLDDGRTAPNAILVGPPEKPHSINRRAPQRQHRGVPLAAQVVPGSDRLGGEWGAHAREGRLPEPRRGLRAVFRRRRFARTGLRRGLRWQPRHRPEPSVLGECRRAVARGFASGQRSLGSVGSRLRLRAATLRVLEAGGGGAVSGAS